MNYYIITKIESLNGVTTYTPIGYVESEEDATSINQAHESFQNWVRDNQNDLKEGIITSSSYFDSNPPSYSANWVTTDIEGMGLDLITDIQNLI